MPPFHQSWIIATLSCGLLASQINKLQMIQNIAARIVTQSRKSDHIITVLHDLHWLHVAQRIKFKVFLFVFKSQNNMTPSYLHDLVKPQQQARTLRSSDQHLLEVPLTRNVSFTGRGFGVAGPRLWNSRPCELRVLSSHIVFKSKLKTLLLNYYYCRM